MIDILARRPVASSLDSIRPWIAQSAAPPVTDRAANAAWSILSAADSLATDEQTSAMRDVARDSYDQLPSPAVARLFALLSEAGDLDVLEKALDADDPAMRRHVAEGLHRRGVRQPLIDRAADDAIYPFAARSIASGPAELATLVRLAALTPPEQHRNVWSDSLLRLGLRLPPAKMIEADALLASYAAVTPELRTELLQRMLAQSAESAPGEDRSAIAAHLGRLLLDLGHPRRAHDALEQTNGLTITPQLRVVRFEAAALAGHYNIAAQHEAEPSAWIDLLRRAAERDVVLAAALRDEIERRFNGSLNGDLKSRFDAVSNRLPRSPA